MSWPAFAQNGRLGGWVGGLLVAFALASSMAAASVISKQAHEALSAAEMPVPPTFADTSHSWRGIQGWTLASAGSWAAVSSKFGSPLEPVEPVFVLPTLGGTGPSIAERWTSFGETLRQPLHERRRVTLSPRSDVLGSVALTISQVPQSRRWMDLLEERADTYFADACNLSRAACTGKLRASLAAAVAVARGQDDRDAVDTVNAAVNSGLKYRRDLDSYSVADYWATAEETLARGSGDCEEFATLKMWMLLAAGFDRSQLRLQLVKVLQTGEDHAILVVDTEASRLVLDNLSAAVRSDNEVREYMPLLSFVGGDAFLHGFKRKPSRTNEVAALR